MVKAQHSQNHKTIWHAAKLVKLNYRLMLISSKYIVNCYVFLGAIWCFYFAWIYRLIYSIIFEHFLISSFVLLFGAYSNFTWISSLKICINDDNNSNIKVLRHTRSSQFGFHVERNNAVFWLFLMLSSDVFDVVIVWLEFSYFYRMYTIALFT